MSGDFLDSRLVTAKRFSPGRRQPAESAPADEPAELQELLRKEDDRTRAKVTERDAGETRRRRCEIIETLEALTTRLRTEAAAAAERVELFGALAEKLRGLPDELKPEDVADVKRAVEVARLEVATFARDRAADARPQAGIDLRSLRRGEWARIGLAITWPLIAAILLSAGAIVTCLFHLFGV